MNKLNKNRPQGRRERDPPLDYVGRYAGTSYLFPVNLKPNAKVDTRKEVQTRPLWPCLTASITSHQDSAHPTLT